MKKNGFFSPERREVLKRLLEKDGVATKQVGIQRWEGNRSQAPLSFAQQRLWMIDQMQPGGVGYNMPAAYHLTGALNFVALEASFNEVVCRHESLRTSFHVHNDEPVQAVATQLDFSIRRIDLSHLPETERETAALHLAVQEAQTPFDLTQSPLLRCTLIGLGGNEYVLLLTMHHIISDGWSVGLLSREAIALYAAFSQSKPSPLPELSIHYVDFAVWQRNWLQGERLEKLQSYWRQALAEMPMLELPTDHPRPVLTSYRGATCSLWLSAQQTATLKAFCQVEGFSLFMVLLAAFLTLLARYTGQFDISVRSPVANRTRQQTEAMIGYFVNILALRVDLSGNPAFRELLGRVSEACQGAFAHQDLPFEQVLEDLHPVRRGRGPLFPVMFILQNLETSVLEVPGGVFRPLQVENSLSLFDLTVSVIESGPSLQIDFNYSSDLFALETIQKMMKNFRGVLERALESPQLALAALAEKIPGEDIPVFHAQPFANREWVADLVLPRNETERILAQIWQDALGVPVGVHDHFFALGGDSLQWMRVIAGIHQAGLHLAGGYPLQTIAEMAAAVTDAVAHDLVPEGPESGFVPLSPNQHWFFEQNFVAPHHFNSAMLFGVSQRLRLDALLVKDVLRQLLLHHDSLRLRFAQREAGWVQWVSAPSEELSLEVIDLSGFSQGDQRREMAVVRQRAMSTLNLSEGPLARMIFFDCGASADSYILLVIHHLLTDGFSSNILFQDFLTGYQQAVQGQPIQLPARTTSFRRWNEALREYAHSRDVLDELPLWQMPPGESLPALPVPNCPGSSFPFKAMYGVAGALDVETTRILQQKILKDYDMQLIEVMLAAMAETFSQLRPGRSLFLDILRHGRDLPLEGVNLSRTVGWFIFHYPLWLKLDNAQSLEEALPLVKAQYRRPRYGGVGYDLLRYINEDPSIKQTLLPRPMVIFSHESAQLPAPADEALIRPVDWPLMDFMNDELAWPYLLELRTTIVNDQLQWEWTSGNTLYFPATLAQFSERFQQILQKLCGS